MTLICMQCEVLSHRLGLVPIHVDPDLLQDKSGTASQGTPPFYCKNEDYLFVPTRLQ
jgi:DNA-directed RNA polymerase alpha subunit